MKHSKRSQNVSNSLFPKQINLKGLVYLQMI